MQAIKEQQWGEDYYFGASFTKPISKYRLDGQHAIQLSLNAGDQLEILSPDQAQTTELIVLDAHGTLAPALLDKRPPVVALGIQQQLEQRGAAAQRLRHQLDTWQLDGASLQQAIKVSGWEHAQFTAENALTVVIAAAGPNMSVEAHTPVTEVDITVTYANLAEPPLPAPLAPIKHELRVNRATAQTYEVKKGEWIQIIDVSGKQCSDFIAFDKQALEQGIVLGLDATATRTVMGLSNPVPGLHSRYLGSDLKPMIEVVQDTVGRHDSFLLACTPKYYEDSGYFGHASCTDNFNQRLAKYGIAPRAGWPAINLFFNTFIDASGAVLMDEPWSRAGDYILLRAERDLICASSACPDDIDPANGWHPTDIHVRIYDAAQDFPRAIAYRNISEELPRMTKPSGFHPRTTALTKKFIDYAGYWVATEYDGWGTNAEYLACRERVAILDLSVIRKFEIVGPDAVAFLQYVLTQNISRMAIGEIAHSAICLETGGMIDDGTIFRMGEQAFRWCCGEEYTGIWMREKAQETGFKVSIRNASAQLDNLAVQGPNSRELLSKLIWTPDSQPAVETLKWFHFTIGRLGGAAGVPVMVSRTGYTGELGYEVWCHPDDSEAVWNAVWQAGQRFQIAPMGLNALDILRIEAGLSMAGHEFDHSTTPFEAGTGFSVPLNTKQENFIGREALSRQAPESRHRLVGMILQGGDPASHGDHVYHGRFPVGIVTSATYSPLMGKQIAIVRVAPDFSSIGTRLEIGKLDGQQKRLAGEVVKLPFYDPKREKLLA
jgi:aminomethyltransferase